VIGLGLCVVDHVYVVDELDLAQTRIRYSEHLELAGGMTATALAQAAALGCEAHVLSALGADREGRLVRSTLRAAGVHTQRLVVSPELVTTVAVCLVARDGGERRFLLPDRRQLEARAPDFDLRSLDARALLLVDGHFPAQALRAVRRAREVGAPVIGDFSRPHERARALLPRVDYPIVPQEFALAWAGGAREALLRLRAEFGGTPIVTLGAAGGLYLEAGRVRRFRSRRVRVVDTTGAGDVFHGAFAAGLVRGLPLAASIELAARAAAESCTALGGMGSLLRAGASRAGRSRARARRRP
jgi:sugar/nucleoside kinase (ribokinase family)